MKIEIRSRIDKVSVTVIVSDDAPVEWSECSKSGWDLLDVALCAQDIITERASGPSKPPEPEPPTPDGELPIGARFRVKYAGRGWPEPRNGTVLGYAGDRIEIMLDGEPAARSWTRVIFKQALRRASIADDVAGAYGPDRLKFSEPMPESAPEPRPCPICSEIADDYKGGGEKGWVLICPNMHEWRPRLSSRASSPEPSVLKWAAGRMWENRHPTPKFSKPTPEPKPENCSFCGGETYTYVDRSSWIAGCKSCNFIDERRDVPESVWDSLGAKKPEPEPRVCLTEGCETPLILVDQTQCSDCIDKVLQAQAKPEELPIVWEPCDGCGSKARPTRRTRVGRVNNAYLFRGNCDECGALRVGTREKGTAVEPSPIIWKDRGALRVGTREKEAPAEEPEPATIVWDDCEECKSEEIPHSIRWAPDSTMFIGNCTGCDGLRIGDRS